MTPCLQHQPTLRTTRSHAPYVSRTLEPSQPTPSRVRSVVSRTCSVALYAFLALAIGWFAWQRYVGNAVLRHSDTLAQATAAAYQPAQPRTKLIEQVQVGERVVAENPLDEPDLQFGDDVDPTTWRKLELVAPKQDGTEAEVTLLRPIAWLEEQQAQVGATIEINVPECGIEGLAKVLAIEPCPPIAPGPGRVVTGTFKHMGAQVIDVYVAGEAEPIGATPNHPFWSEDRQDFVRADELLPDERLRTLQGETRVVHIQPRPGPETVYNLEVQVDHTYRVTSAGVLVHNAKPCPDIALGKGIGLEDFANSRNASYYKRWNIDSVTRRDVRTNFASAFHQAADRTPQIHFNLDDVGDITQAIKKGAHGLRDGNVTFWELSEIVRNSKWLEKTRFYRKGQEVSLNDLLNE